MPPPRSGPVFRTLMRDSFGRSTMRGAQQGSSSASGRHKRACAAPNKACAAPSTAGAAPNAAATASGVAPVVVLLGTVSRPSDYQCLLCNCWTDEGHVKKQPQSSCLGQRASGCSLLGSW